MIIAHWVLRRYDLRARQTLWHMGFGLLDLGVQGFSGSGVSGLTVRGFSGSRFRGSGIQRFRGSGVPGSRG